MGNPPWERHQGVKKERERGKELGDLESSRNFGEEADSVSQTPLMLQFLPASPGSLCWC